MPLDRTALGRAATDHAVDAVFRHEVEGALGAALGRLQHSTGSRGKYARTELTCASHVFMFCACQS